MFAYAQSVWVIIPAFNEEAVIHDVVRTVYGVFPNIVVVDDGSIDRTGEEAKRAGATVLKHPLNLGQGAALQTGITWAVRQSAMWLVTFDADGQHNIFDVPKMIEQLIETDADVALGSRFSGATIGMPWQRRIVLKMAIWFTRATTGLCLTDVHNGLRVLTRRAACSLHLRQNRMAHASEILHQIASRGLKYIEVPVTISYSQYSLAKGQRSSSSLRIIMDMVLGGIQR
jgi:glycosyltransferase involved in cell wall biosynthesis